MIRSQFAESKTANVHQKCLTHCATSGEKSGAMLPLVFICAKSNELWHMHLCSSSLLSDRVQHLPIAVHAQAFVPWEMVAQSCPMHLTCISHPPSNCTLCLWPSAPRGKVAAGSNTGPLMILSKPRQPASLRA